MGHFTRKRLGWGPPKTWQGWAFLGMWCLAFTAVASQPPSLLGGVLSLALLAFLVYVARVTASERGRDPLATT